VLVASLGRFVDLVRRITLTARCRARRRLLAGLTVTAVCLLWSPVSSLGDLHQDLASRSQDASRLRAAIAAETRRIDATSAGVREAEARLTALQADLDTREAQLAAVQRRIVAARNRLTGLENRLHRAATLLAANLVASYKDGTPDVMTVILESDGFADMLERLHFMERVRRQNADILRNTRAARVQVLAQAERLERLDIRYRSLTTAVLRSRDAAAAVQGALLARQAAQLRERATTTARLSRVRGRISTLRRQIARLNHPVISRVGGGGLPVDAGGMAQAPDGAPAAVKQVIAAGNAIAGLPYAYGGGHGAFRADAYDCSGSVSYALAAAGLLSSPLDSTGFESWGDAGPGRWITVYANAGHAFMVVAGWRFDTSALSQDRTRWTRTMRSTAGFVARHPPGL
jgi:cell wall-associated NlpC family hydrolase